MPFWEGKVKEAFSALLNAYRLSLCYLGSLVVGVMPGASARCPEIKLDHFDFKIGFTDRNERILSSLKSESLLNVYHPNRSMVFL